MAKVKNLFGVFLGIVFPTIAFSGDCSHVFEIKSQPRIEIEQNIFVTVDGISIESQSSQIPMAVIHELQITTPWVQKWYNSDAAILSIGEGIGPLLPFLLNEMKIRNVKALDTWYSHQSLFPKGAQGDQMRKFVSQYSDHLITGDAAHIPFPDHSLDAVIGGNLLNNLHVSKILDVLVDSVRVLKAGESKDELGPHARFNGIFPPSLQLAITKYMHEVYPGALEITFTGKRFDTVLVVRKIAQALPQSVANSYDPSKSYPEIPGINGGNKPSAQKPPYYQGFRGHM